MDNPHIKAVANRGDVTYEDSLPFRHVYYPGYFGTFLGFSENSDSDICLCSCSKEAVTNYLQLTHELNIFRMAVDHIIVSYRHFPEQIVNELLLANAPNDLGVFKHLRFKDTLCHKCNQAVPYYRYCSEIYGGIFQQTYGWYIDQKLFNYGIDPGGFHMAPEAFPQPIISILSATTAKYKEEYPQMFMRRPFSISCSSLEHQEVMKEFRRVAENEIRSEIEYKELGKENINEKILLNIICSLYPGTRILHRARPHFLNGLELDIYLPDLSVGIEYQGAQHYQPVEHWGGDEAFRNTKSRDKNKKRLCKKHGIQIVYFSHKEILSRELVQYKLRKHNL
jgi:hypothetical protein